MLSANGPVAEVLDNFSARSSQQQMTTLVEQAFVSANNVIIEAPSGSGKTLAYLMPIFAQNKKAIISTATHYLQNQLYRQDIPLLQQALSTTRKVAVLKGRYNYLCPYYLDKNSSGAPLYDKRNLAKGASDTHNRKSQLTAAMRSILLCIAQKFRESNCGELSVLAPELDASLRAYVTCSAEECLGKACPQFSRCPLMRARQQAQQADIVIVNHSLLFSDRLMRREQLGSLLPESEVVVIDEAHRLADFAQRQIGEHLSSQQLSRFCRDAFDCIQRCTPEQRALLAFLKHLQQVIARLNETVPSLDHYDRRQHISIIDQLLTALYRLEAWLEPLLDRDIGLTELSIRAQLLQRKLRKIKAPSGLCWVEARPHGCILHNVPLELSALVQEIIAETEACWVFTSATLSVVGSPDRFIQSLGLTCCSFYRLDSEINYQQNACLYLPILTVEPGHPEYNGQLVTTVNSLVEFVNGRHLFLLSSHYALNQAANSLQGMTDLPLFIQGTADNYQLIEKFKRSDNGILLGTGSFWEGLDLSGVSLSTVIIDKLPFASPEEPLIKLRADELNEHGVDSFQHYLLPDAVIRLRQGCGRLLRRLQDRGIIMLADPRLHSKPYGPVFLESLPAMQRCSSLEPLADFFAADNNIAIDDLTTT